MLKFLAMQNAHHITSSQHKCNFTQATVSCFAWLLWSRVESLWLCSVLRFQVLSVTSMKMAAFWDVVPCRLIHINHRFRAAYLSHRPNDRGSKHLWNVGQYLPAYMMQYPRQPPLCSMLFIKIVQPQSQ